MALYNQNGRGQASKVDPDEKHFSLNCGASKRPTPVSNRVMKEKWISSVVLTTLVAGGLFAADVAQKKMTTMQIFMRQKLGYSEKIFEGITLENYSLVILQRRSAEAHDPIQYLDGTEESAYLEKTDHFQADVTAMLDAAGASNTPHSSQSVHPGHRGLRGLPPNLTG